jgi:hypothetical protein
MSGLSRGTCFGTLLTPQPRRLSLRGLIIVVLLAGGLLGWFVRSARIQRQAVAAIEKAGGSVAYEWDFQNGSPIPNGKPWCGTAQFFGAILERLESATGDVLDRRVSF